ncbi:hypothetical protein M409DRAFT_29944 [Zasmidium cellare ATCC 36951]|uniref:NADP-dependent oxidoreductase domain-containing protein n=1 Tax=Zasmidium cellare ATCC 36951 TaxID=1080233 RepID=A0A6A6BY37_ZASCE|nr:uncharacterized protein M409DRAFT_29944 [Zasmidium cellare ATCC 36951]KAF2159625.1 hypothetical protein M409DRAFT_29944 [Zasmidium cellare ATCC 36951]
MPSSIAGKPIGPIGMGLMALTHPGKHPPTSSAVATMKAALTAGCNFWDGGWFYGTPTYNSCHLLAAYFTQYPKDADKVVISMKACFDMATATAQNDAKGVKENIEKCLAVLDGKCKIDVFQPARLDPDVPVEETVSAIAEFVKEGNVGGVGLSECSAESVRRGSKVFPIAAAEIELSLFSTDPLTNGILEACEECEVPLVAYSPLGKGFLSGAFRSIEDIPENDYRRTFFPRFAKEAFEENLKLVDEVGKIAEKKGVTVAQVAIAWVRGLGRSEKAPVVPIPSVSSIARVDENLKVVELSKEERRELDEVLKRIEVKGARAPGRFEKFLEV